MKRSGGKSHCPINFGLEAFGDPWSLLIVRDVVYSDKHTFNGFLASEEAIAPSVLAARLDGLVQAGVLHRSPDPADKRRVRYSLTERGLDLIPLLLEMAEWSAGVDPQTQAPPDWITYVKANKTEAIARVRETVSRGGSVFVGDDSVVAQLADESTNR